VSTVMTARAQDLPHDLGPSIDRRTEPASVELDGSQPSLGHVLGRGDRIHRALRLTGPTVDTFVGSI
jgi:hypothetical protein